MHWIFSTQQAAETASRMIVLLGARVMDRRGGWLRDAGLRPIGRTLTGQWRPDVVRERWDLPRETTAGAWAILDPSSAVLMIDGVRTPVAGLTLTEAPKELADDAGATVPDYSQLYLMLGLLYAPGDEETEITLPALAWVRVALAALGLAFTEGVPKFPPDEELL